jgi:leucyl aminopeptidase (aminopeptidase T)
MCAHRLTLLGGLLFAGLLSAAPAGDEPKNGKERDHDNLAQNVVTRSARIAEGDLVQINGSPRDASLLEALAVHVRKLGGHPLITLSSPRLARRMFDDVPAKFDAQTPEFAMKMAGLVNAVIGVESMDEETFAGVPAERLAAVAKASAGVYPLLLKRNVRMVGLGNGLYPTAARAKQFGISESELAKLFWDGLNVDYAKMQATGEELQKILSSAREVHLTNANGTDLKLRIEKRPVYVSDGVLTPEKQKKGGPACQMWLPAGEVYVSPVPDTAEGKVVIDRYFHEGKPIEGLTLTVKGGKVTAIEAKAGAERLLAQYKAAGAGKDRLSILDIGINPNVRIPANSKVLTYMPAGMITIGTGNDTWAGGDNTADFGLAGFLPKCTLKVDGRVIVEEGALKL